MGVSLSDHLPEKAKKRVPGSPPLRTFDYVRIGSSNFVSAAFCATYARHHFGTVNPDTCANPDIAHSARTCFIGP